MKILIVSHNVFCDSTNMGKTLKAYFSAFNSNELAQFFIYPEEPSSSNCNTYFRFTDFDAIKSIFGKENGNIYTKDNINSLNVEKSPVPSKIKWLYKLDIRKKPIGYLLRNFLWNHTKWFNKKLKRWIDQFSPDVVFFASGDSSFLYNVALQIAEYAKCKLVISCMDDYYFSNYLDHSFLGRYIHKELVEKSKIIFEKSNFAITLCEKMSEDYEMLFNKKCYVVPNSYSIFTKKEFINNDMIISYIGNLGLGRYLNLIKIGKTLQEIDNNLFLDIYSGETNSNILKEMNEDNGIKFHGKINSEEVYNVLNKSSIVIHTESFDQNLIERVKYSVSTKIPESLKYGPCILAYGPINVASIDYLKNNEAAYIIDNENDLKIKLETIINDKNLRMLINSNANDLAEKNHNPKINGQILRELLKK